MTEARTTETIEAEGHLIDSQLLQHIFDKVIERGATYEVLEFRIGTTNEDMSYARLKLAAASAEVLRELVRELVPLGCRMVDQRDARFEAAPKDRCVPHDFYSTTNHRTQVRIEGRWVDVAKQRMDAVVVLENGIPACRKLRDVKGGDRLVCGVDGIRVNPEFVQRDRHGFSFMSNDISSERRVEVSVGRVAEMIRDVKRSGGRVAVVAGPVVIHTGGIDYFCQLVRGGWIDVLLSGNALAVHDIEYALYGTSLGVDLQTGSPVEEGHKNHMRAINAVNHAGSVRAAVEQGVVKSGIMHALVQADVDFVLAGSIRDDGPLPDTLMDLVEAQERYAQALDGVKLVLMLSTMLHSIGVGNMLPSWVRVVCVDINPAVVTKLADRGSAQTIGVVTDVGLFLHMLAARLAPTEA
ncbi:MAG: TIGR00300 family protein [Planctomycetota bacterium]|nr:TIGR00300 family protein [Planctomycetota bacterium]